LGLHYHVRKFFDLGSGTFIFDIPFRPDVHFDTRFSQWHYHAHNCLWYHRYGDPIVFELGGPQLLYNLRAVNNSVVPQHDLARYQQPGPSNHICASDYSWYGLAKQLFRSWKQRNLNYFVVSTYIPKVNPRDA
jgi:hypothetical protein